MTKTKNLVYIKSRRIFSPQNTANLILSSFFLIFPVLLTNHSSVTQWWEQTTKNSNVIAYIKQLKSKVSVC